MSTYFDFWRELHGDTHCHFRDENTKALGSWLVPKQVRDREGTRTQITFCQIENPQYILQIIISIFK